MINISSISFREQIIGTYSTEKLRTLAIYALAFSLFFVAISMSLMTVGYLFAVACAVFMMKDKLYWEAIVQNPITYWLLGFYALFIVGVFYSLGSWKQCLYDLYQYSWIITTIPLLSLFCDPKERFVPLYAFLAGMFFVMCLSYLGYFEIINSNEGLGLLLNTHFTNYNSSVFTRHITQNFAMAFASAIWLYFIYFKHFKQNRYCIVAFILTALNVLCISTGRTGYLSFVILVLVLSYYRFGFKKIWIAALGLVLMLLAAFIFSSNFSTRVKAMHTNYQDYKVGKTQTDIGLRLAMAVNDVSLIQKHPIFGFGTGGFGPAYAMLDQKAIETNGAQMVASEMTYLNIFIELGVIGFGFMVAFFFFLWSYALRIDHEGKIIFLTFFFCFLAGGIFTAFLSHTFARYFFSTMLAMTFINFKFLKSSRT